MTENELQTYLKSYIRVVEDFPQPGIPFLDITPLLANAAAFERATESLAALAPPSVSVVVGIEARGFIFGAVVAKILQMPFIPARKPGKLPRETISEAYELEYGEDSLHIHAGDIPVGAQVLIADDIIATGGTLRAVANMIESQSAEVAETVCLIELVDLGGRERYGHSVKSVLQY
ncbi:MAG: adenine phosphoribosyltransferase [Gammaproteobacteria bacterium WSBS_2016_MAG_OTU1]